MEPFLAFALAMAMLAASPGPGLAAILSRAITGGALAGFRVVVGLVAADFVFLGIAIAGMAAVSSALGPMFQVVKYIAAGYLIFVGIQTIRSSNNVTATTEPKNNGGIVGDVVRGAVVTLGNPKAILFYGALLPTFFDVSQLSWAGFLVICLLITVVSFAVYGVYIALATKSVSSAKNSRLLKRLKVGSGLTMIGAGATIAAKD